MNEPSALPLVSILVNNHNYGRYVCEAVDSALGQTWPNVEVIVVDDGSTDDSIDRLARIADPRLRVIAQSNLGQSGAYNAGWAQARGRYVVFLDADDRLDADVVTRCMDAFDEQTVKVQFALRIIDAAGCPTGAVHPPELDENDCRALVRRYGLHASAPGSGNCYAASFLHAVMPIDRVQEMRIGADTWCILMAPFYGEVRSLAAPGGGYRVVRPVGVDALRVIGNASASPAQNVVKTVAVTSIVFDALRRAGRIDRSEPEMPSPPLLRAWVLARLDRRDLPRGALWGRDPDAVTILRSVWGWRAYGARKKVCYAVYLLVGRYLPRPLARGTVRVAARVLA
jgi:hypothetical protein